MIGRVGTAFGEEGVNIVSRRRRRTAPRRDRAVMASPPTRRCRQDGHRRSWWRGDGFVDGRAVTLG